MADSPNVMLEYLEYEEREKRIAEIRNRPNLNDDLKLLLSEIDRLNEDVDKAIDLVAKATLDNEKMRRREQKLIDVIRSIKPFLDSDFPDGTDSNNCASAEYRAAYREIYELCKELGVNVD